MRKKAPESLRLAARRASQDPFFLGYPLSQYREREGLEEEELAGVLGCAPEDIVMLALCRQPRSSPREFRVDIIHIAERFGLNAGALASLIRRVEALEAITDEAAASSSQLLLAARDREEEMEDG